jgi:hypothetical protein
LEKIDGEVHGDVRGAKLTAMCRTLHITAILPVIAGMAAKRSLPKPFACLRPFARAFRWLPV